MSSATILTSWALLIWKTLDQKGINPKLAFDACDLDTSLLSDANARYPMSKMYRLWESAISMTRDPEFGVDVGRNWSPTTFNALGFVWLASSSLNDALKKAVRYSHIVNNAVVVKFEPEGVNFRYTLALNASDEIGHPAAADAGIASITTMCRMLLGESFSPISISLRRQPDTAAKLTSFVRCNVEYNSPSTSFLFDGKQVLRSLPSGNQTLSSLNEKIIVDYLQWLDKNDVASAVKSKIIELLPSGKVNEQLIADALNLNLRTMQRRLEKQQETFKELLNHVRHQLVLSYIHNSRLSLTEIAYMLGFSDQANFTRAFKRWFDMPPSQYRKTHPYPGEDISLPMEASR